MKRILFHQPQCTSFVDNLRLLRVELSADYTKMDFGYRASEKQEKGRKIRISKKTYLWDKKNKFKLTRAFNIPIAPNSYYFKTTDDWLFFSLYFEPLPIKTSEIMLMDEEFDKMDFNIWDITLTRESQFEIK
ncbi:MAG: hypothetical protein WAQ28_03660 [Bacteroidia bacterium]